MVGAIHTWLNMLCRSHVLYMSTVNYALLCSAAPNLIKIPMNLHSSQSTQTISVIQFYAKQLNSWLHTLFKRLATAYACIRTNNFLYLYIYAYIIYVYTAMSDFMQKNVLTLYVYSLNGNIWYTYCKQICLCCLFR